MPTREELIQQGYDQALRWKKGKRDLDKLGPIMQQLVLLSPHEYQNEDGSVTDQHLDKLYREARFSHPETRDEIMTESQARIDAELAKKAREDGVQAARDYEREFREEGLRGNLKRAIDELSDGLEDHQPVHHGSLKEDLRAAVHGDDYVPPEPEIEHLSPREQYQRKVELAEFNLVEKRAAQEKQWLAEDAEKKALKKNMSPATNKPLSVRESILAARAEVLENTSVGE